MNVERGIAFEKPSTATVRLLVRANTVNPLIDAGSQIQVGSLIKAGVGLQQKPGSLI